MQEAKQPEVSPIFRDSLTFLARTTTLRLNNVTSSTLVRTEYSIVTGTWTTPPPENISPNNTVSFGTTSKYIKFKEYVVISFQPEIDWDEREHNL